MARVAPTWKKKPEVVEDTEVGSVEDTEVAGEEDPATELCKAFVLIVLFWIGISCVVIIIGNFGRIARFLIRVGSKNDAAAALLLLMFVVTLALAVKLVWTRDATKSNDDPYQNEGVLCMMVLIWMLFIFGSFGLIAHFHILDKKAMIGFRVFGGILAWIAPGLAAELVHPRPRTRLQS